MNHLFARLSTALLAPLFMSGLLLGANIARAQLPDFTPLAEQNSPAVVNISTTQKIKRQHRGLPPGMQIPDMPEGFEDFFERYFGERGGPDGGGGEPFQAQSLGSGFVISADGYVLTNHHVIKDADEIIVRLSDRRELEAKLIGSDPKSDLALLKIEAKDLPMVRVGRSSALKVGEWVLAIGSPFGFDHSVTAGIVSAIGRSLPSENYVPFIQTDVAINPGNSGGPLFNMSGEVVGINSQIYSRTGGYMGLSFAIPIEVAMESVAQIKDKGHVSRAWLGVMIQDVTRELAESFGMKKPAGALVAQVTADSPSARAGIKVGDVILKFDGKEVEQSSALPPLVGRSKIGEDVEVEVLREGKTRTLDVKLEELKEDEGEVLAGGSQGERTHNRLGIVAGDLTAEQRQQLEIGEGGVLVSDVSDGPAFEAGIRRGDVILMLNNTRIKDVQHFSGLVKALPEGRPLPLLVQRRGQPLFLALQIGKR
jgi:serine protease Do